MCFWEKQLLKCDIYITTWNCIYTDKGGRKKDTISTTVEVNLWKLCFTKNFSLSVCWEMFQTKDEAMFFPQNVSDVMFAIRLANVCWKHGMRKGNKFNQEDLKFAYLKCVLAKPRVRPGCVYMRKHLWHLLPLQSRCQPKLNFKWIMNINIATRALNVHPGTVCSRQKHTHFICSLVVICSALVLRQKPWVIF